MRNELSLQKSILLFNGRNGIYIPQFFAEEMLHSNCSYEFVTIHPTKVRWWLKELSQGSDNEFYWDNWNDILSFFTEIQN